MRGADSLSPGATAADTSVQTSELIRCQARCRTGTSDSGTNTAWQSSTGHLQDGEKLLMHSACCMHHISIYIHRAHTLLEHPLAHLGCLWLLDKGWCGSQFAPVKPPALASTLQRGQEQQWASTACKARVDGQSECSTSGKLSFTLTGLGWPPHCYLVCPRARRKPHRSDTAFSP